MTPNLHQIKVTGRYGQGHDPLLTSRSQGQSQGHQGHFRFFSSNFKRFRGILIYAWRSTILPLGITVFADFACLGDILEFNICSALYYPAPRPQIPYP